MVGITRSKVIIKDLKVIMTYMIPSSKTSTGAKLWKKKHVKQKKEKHPNLEKFSLEKWHSWILGVINFSFFNQTSDDIHHGGLDLNVSMMLLAASNLEIMLAQPTWWLPNGAQALSLHRIRLCGKRCCNLRRFFLASEVLDIPWHYGGDFDHMSPTKFQKRVRK